MTTLIRIFILSVASLVIGVGVNFLSPTPLPLIANADQFKIQHAEGVEVVSSEIIDLWNSGVAIFVDSRSAEAFKEGHIPGSISVPYKAIEEGEIPETVDLLPKDQDLVIYCDGADCHSSQVVYDKLEELGFDKEKMKIFSGGWVDWVNNKGEIEKSEGEENGG